MQVELTAPIPKIEFCDVSCSYPGSARPALKNVNLTLTAGSLYTIIGENGSGKSTLIKLMLGLYTPTQGEIMVNEKPISTWSPPSLRKQMSAVFQNQIHYPFDVKTNIGVGEPSRITNCNDVHSAAEWARADFFIQQLPHGYETQLCKEWKDGFEFSGGQWQRIALARFLFLDASLATQESRNLYFNLTTNLSLMTAEMARFFAAIPIFSLTVSIDGPQECNSCRVYNGN